MSVSSSYDATPTDPTRPDRTQGNPTRTDPISATSADARLVIPIMSERRFRLVMCARWTMALTGVAQIATAIPSMFAKYAHHADHEARHIAAFAISLGVGMIYAALRPHRAAGMVPSFIALGLGLTVSCALHLASGELPQAAELTHLFAPLGAGVLWVLAHASRPGMLRSPTRKGANRRATQRNTSSGATVIVGSR